MFLILSRAFRSVALIFATLALPLYLATLHYSLVFIGIIYFFVIFFNAAISFLLGMLGDRIGFQKTLVLGELLPLVGLTLIALTVYRPVIIVGVIVSGISGVAGGLRGSFSPNSQAFIARNWNKEKERVSKIAAINAVAGFSAVFGGILLASEYFISGALGPVLAFRVLFGISALLLAVSVASLSFLKEKRAPLKRHMFLKRESGNYVARIGLANLINGMGLGVALPLFPLWLAVRYGVNNYIIGVLFSLSYITTAMAALYSSRVVRSRDIDALTVGSNTRVLQGAMLIAIALMPTFWLAGLFFIIRTLFYGFGSPFRSVITMKGLDASDYGTGISTVGLVSRFSQLTSGFAGYLMEYYLPSTLIFGGVFQVFGGIAYGKLLRKKTDILINQVSK
jgi:MFS family permease